MMVFIAVMLMLFMATVAFSVDVARMHLSRAELRASTDAACKAAAGELARSQDKDLAIARGIDIASRNTVAGDPLVLIPGDFTFGRSEEQINGKFAFVSGGARQNSVRVNGRRTVGSPSGPVPMMFGNLFGLPEFDTQLDSTATYVERDVALVVDRSGSMGWYDPTFGTKYDALVNAIDVFVDTLQSTPTVERAGMASYNDTATVDIPISDNLDQLKTGIRSLPVGGFTSISRGMDAGETVLESLAVRDFVERTMIVMTDGRHNRGPEPRIPAQRLADAGVTIHTITFGGDADRDRMREVATIGGGRYYHADDGDDLEDIYREIALSLSTMMTQ